MLRRNPNADNGSLTKPRRGGQHLPSDMNPRNPWVLSFVFVVALIPLMTQAATVTVNKKSIVVSESGAPTAESVYIGFSGFALGADVTLTFVIEGQTQTNEYPIATVAATDGGYSWDPPTAIVTGFGRVRATDGSQEDESDVLLLDQYWEVSVGGEMVKVWYIDQTFDLDSSYADYFAGIVHTALAESHSVLVESSGFSRPTLTDVYLTPDVHYWRNGNKEIVDHAERVDPTPEYHQAEGTGNGRGETVSGNGQIWYCRFHSYLNTGVYYPQSMSADRNGNPYSYEFLLSTLCHEYMHLVQNSMVGMAASGGGFSREGVCVLASTVATAEEFGTQLSWYMGNFSNWLSSGIISKDYSYAGFCRFIYERHLDGGTDSQKMEAFRSLIPLSPNGLFDYQGQKVAFNDVFNEVPGTFATYDEAFGEFVLVNYLTVNDIDSYLDQYDNAPIYRGLQLPILGNSAEGEMSATMTPSGISSATYSFPTPYQFAYYVVDLGALAGIPMAVDCSFSGSGSFSVNVISINGSSDADIRHMTTYVDGSADQSETPATVDGEPVERVVLAITRLDTDGDAERAFSMQMAPLVTGSPRVYGHSPVAGAADVDRTSTVNVEFSQTVDMSTVTETSFQVVGSVQGAYDGVFYSYGEAHGVGFIANTEFEASETVTVTLTPGIENVAGVPLDGDGDGAPGGNYEWLFTTADHGASPMIVTITPSPDDPTEGEEVTFAVGVSGGTGVYTNFAWDLDCDGVVEATRQSGSSVSMTYHSGGNVLVSCTVWDSSGGSSSKSIVLVVEQDNRGNTTIDNVLHSPAVVMHGTEPHVWANVYNPAGITEVKAYRSTSPSGPFTRVHLMQHEQNTTYRTASAFPDESEGTTVYYYIKAYDQAGGVKSSAIYSYRVQGSIVDRDHDGYPRGIDCDDWDPLIHPGAMEIPGNGEDDDCDGLVDETCPRLAGFVFDSGHEFSDPYRVRAVAIADLNGDGTKEVVYIGRNENFAFDAQHNQIFEVEHDLDIGTDCGIVVADLDFNGTKEIIVGEGGFIGVFRSNGTRLWSKTTCRGKNRFGVGDVNGDGVQDVVVGYGTSDYDRLRAYQGPSGSTLWTVDLDEDWVDDELREDGQGRVISLAVGHMDSDNEADIMASISAFVEVPQNEDTDHLVRFEGDDGDVDRDRDLGDHGEAECMVMADVDFDGDMEVVFGGYGYLEVRDHPLTRLGRSSTGFNVEYVAVGDIDGDWQFEIIGGGDNARITAMRYDGTLMWHHDTGISDDWRLASFDFDHDGKWEVVAACEDSAGHVIVLDGDANLVDQFECGDNIEEAIAVGDVGSDCLAEIGINADDQPLLYHAQETGARLVSVQSGYADGAPVDSTPDVAASAKISASASDPMHIFASVAESADGATYSMNAQVIDTNRSVVVADDAGDWYVWSSDHFVPGHQLVANGEDSGAYWAFPPPTSEGLYTTHLEIRDAGEQALYEQEFALVVSTIEAALLSPTNSMVCEGVVDVSWAAHESYGDALDISLSVSCDGGTMWTSVVEHTQNDGLYVWDTSAFPDSTNYTMRIRASNGHFEETAQTKGTFSIGAGQAMKRLQVQSEYSVCDPPTGTHDYPENTLVTNSITSTVTQGTTQYVCTGWTLMGGSDISGYYTGTNHQVIVNLTNDTELVWHWMTNYWVDVESAGPGAFDIEDSWQQKDSAFSVTAIPSNYCHFVCWSGSVDSVSNVLTVTVTAPLQLIGHFAATYATNGTPVWWLASHGLTNADWNTEALGDQDGDGHWTWQEYITGTDPTNILSILSLATPQKVGDEIVVRWQSVADHEYSLSRATDLMQDFTTIASPIPATPPMNTYTDSVSGMESVFYQVHTPPIPMAGHFDLGTVIDFLPTNQTYGLGYTIPVPQQNGDLLCTFCERSNDPSWTTCYVRHVLLGSDLSVAREPADLVDGYDTISRFVHHTDSDGAVFAAIRNSGGKDPMRFMRYSSATDTSVLVGTLNQWPTGAFSDNNLRNLVRTQNGKLVLFNGWRYNVWSTAKEDLYAMVSTNDMESWSAWIYGGRVGGEGVVTVPTCLPVSNDVVIACLQTDWGGTDNCVVTLFDAETQTFGSLFQVCDGELARMFLDRNTGDLAIAYVDAGQVYVRYSSLDDPSTWSAATLLDSTAPTPCIDIATSSESPSPFVQDAHYLLYTSSGRQRLYRWEGGTTWTDQGALPKEHPGAYSAGRVVADAQGRAVVVQLFEDGGNYVTHIRVK